MKRTLFALLVSLSAIAQSPAPVVESLTPSQGPETGGTTVVIRGTNLFPTVACVLPCPSRVAFGDVAVDAIEVSDRELRAITPPHAAGVVDVTISVLGRPSITLDDAFTFTEGGESRYERVLLPIALQEPVSGANGTQWETDFWIYNGGTGPAAIANRICPQDMACPPVIPLTTILLPGYSLDNPRDFFSPNRNNPSLVLYVDEQAAPNVAMGLRVADTSRHDLNAGTELPVIRESEFLTRTSQLLNVPLDNQTFRVLLRVYDLALSESRFEVRVYPAGETSAPAIYSQTLTASTPRQGEFRGEAAYAELDFTALLNARIAWPDVARIEIQPLTPGSRYWAMLSLTNNETQLVTLVTPQ